MIRASGTCRLLFVCSRNKWRSLTAEKIFHGINGYDVRSAGTEDSARIKVTSGHVGWADIIFVMEKKHARRLRDKYDYQYMDEDLIEILKSRVSEYIDVPE